MAEPIPNPLLALHERAGAEWQAHGDVQIVSTFGQPPLEYSALHKSCGLMDLPQRGVLEVTGKDRLDFLNRMITNQTFDKQTKSGLKAGEGVYAFLLNGKGRIVADMNVLELGERTWLEMDARLIEGTRNGLEKYVFSEKVGFSSRLGSLHEIGLYGPKGRETLNLVAGTPVSELKTMGSASMVLLGVEVTVWRDDLGGYRLLLPSERTGEVWSKLIEKFCPADQPHWGMRPVGWAAFNAMRIEAGRPMHGIDFDDTVLPAETGLLDRAVSFTKGCYLGQEVVARMHARGQLARKVVGFRMEGDFLPLAGTAVHDDQSNAVGGVTSSTMSPILSNAAIGLALVKKPFYEIGKKLIIPAEGGMREGRVVGVPFVGSQQI